MKIVLVIEKNNKVCKHNVGIGQSCDDCAKIRGVFLQKKMKDLKTRVANYDKWFEINSAKLIGLDMNVANKKKK